MTIAIFGAGGIGAHLAAKLGAAGTPVTLIARGAHLDAIRSAGLRFVEPEATTVARPELVTDDAGAIGTPDAIFVTVKGHQLAAALEAIAPAVGPETRVLTVQNGVDAPDMAAAAFGDTRALICVARVFSNITAPGEVTRYGRPGSYTIGRLDGGQDDPVVAELRATLEAAGIAAPACDDVRVDLWEKFILFNAVSSTTSGARTRLGAVRAHPPLAALARRLMQETWETGRAEGIALSDDAVDRMWAYFEALPPEGRASTAHDLERGLALEIDFICGAVARRGRRLGLDVTASETVAALLAPWKSGATA